jgi:hypothetical protein
MGTTLEGKQINQTYQGLLKTTDNNEVGSSAKEITDGKGNGTGVTLDNSGNLVANATVTANAFVGDASQLTNVPNDVTSVNSQTGDVVLDTDDVAEGSNEYYTDAKVEANSAVAANTAKVGITTQQASDIQTNNSKVGITTEQASEIAANTLKVGITTNQANAIIANTAKNSYPTDDASKLAGIEDNADVTDTENVTSGLVSATSISEDDKAAIRSNIGAGGATAVSSVNSQTGTVVLDTDDISEGTNKYTTAANLTKLGHISVSQAIDLDTIESDVATNNAKVSMVLGTSAGTALEGDTALLQLGTTSTTALAGDTTTISTQQASDISTNNAKVGITTGQADAIVANTAKTGITTEQADAIVANTSKVGITTQQASDITTNNAKISFDSTSSTKLGTIAEGAEVNVNADWNATSGDAEILNKPTIPTNNNQLTNGAGYITDGNTGWDNSYGFITASSTDTLTNKGGNNSQWTNDAGYINEAAQTIHTNAIGNAIDFSARVTLDGGVAEGTSGIIKNLQNIL